MSSHSLPSSLPPCLCLAGPTASGKTAAALAIARAIAPERPVEIISVDSALVYRGMDIGTAKPSQAERGEVVHHLIDILDPSETYSAAAFAKDALRLAHEISHRGHLPLLVGGTMLYFKALFEGLDAMPPADPEVREVLSREIRERGLGVLYEELRQVDPTTAARLSPNDSQRIHRALEVYRSSGQPLSSFQHGKSPRLQIAPPLLSLEPRDRAWLHQRIDLRLRLMLRDGLVEEVRHLMQRPDLHPEMPSMRCVGYRQTWESLQNGRLDELADRCIAATRQLAKRQITWLRSMPDRHILACDDEAAVGKIVDWARGQVRSLRMP